MQPKPKCKTCGKEMTLLDEDAQRWYCYYDDMIFLAKSNSWSDEEPVPGQRLSSILKKTVSDSNGRVIGTLEDFELAGSNLSLIVKPKEASQSELIIDMADVASIYDIILLKTKYNIENNAIKACTCGTENPIEARFCRGCGKALA